MLLSSDSSGPAVAVKCGMQLRRFGGQSEFIRKKGQNFQFASSFGGDNSGKTCDRPIGQVHVVSMCPKEETNCPFFRITCRDGHTEVWVNWPAWLERHNCLHGGNFGIFRRKRHLAVKIKIVLLDHFQCMQGSQSRAVVGHCAIGPIAREWSRHRNTLAAMYFQWDVMYFNWSTQIVSYSV